MIDTIKAELSAYKSPQKAKVTQGFFKTKKGEYGEGDIFLGVSVPNTRKVAKANTKLSQSNILKLLKSPIHEERLLALLILVEQYNTHQDQKENIYQFYLKHSKRVNNWDLVDLSSYQIVGNYLLSRDKSILSELAVSNNLWQRRISIVSTFAFIQQNKHKSTLTIAKILLNDSHDLIQKAVGWMLREVGKRELNTLELFLQKHYKVMPRTMLRYAIERFSEPKRQRYLKGKVSVVS